MAAIELRIRITRENAEKVTQLIRELVQLEPGISVATPVKVGARPLPEKTLLDYLGPPQQLENLKSGEIVLTPAAKYVGTWGQFNSFFPVKAVLRILSHAMNDNGGEPVNLEELVEKSKTIFKVARLDRFRGFPSSDKDSAIGRLVWHFITPAHEMGLVRIEGMEEIPVRGWGKVIVTPTKEGLEFAKLRNLIFDERDTRQLLSDSEREWVLDYLRKIDDKGYKEYSLLKGVFEEFKKGNTSIASWLENNQRFVSYVKSWSRKAEQERELKKQVANVATMFAQSKIALLRELGMISDRRNEYTVIRDLEVVPCTK